MCLNVSPRPRASRPRPRGLTGQLARLRLRIDELTDRVNDIYIRQIQFEDYLQKQAELAEQAERPADADGN